jgi:hypothetical protein
MGTEDDLPQNERKPISKNPSVFRNEFSMDFVFFRSGTIKHTNHAISDHELRNIQKRTKPPII